jgi:hypothetical protein
MRFYYIEQDGEVKDVVDEVFLSSDVQKRNDFYTWVQGRKFYIPFFEEGPEQKKYKKFYKPLVYTRKEKHPTDLYNLDGDY